MRKLKFFTGVVFLIFLFTSCRTAELFKDTEYMHIMVYDLNNTPLQGMKFYLDGSEVGESDVYGRLSVVVGLNPDTDEHIIEGKKETYLNIRKNIVKKTGGVLYFKSGTVQMYLSSAENSVDKGEYAQALSYIESAESMDKGEDVLLLKAIVLKKLGRTEEYEALMNELSYMKTIREVIGDYYE